ncbi:MAG: hypothetical protein AB1649_02280 [Chloroflexota bacterium]
MESLVLHEQADAGHVDRIFERMMNEAVLRDPPIVSMAANNIPCYLVLEGADCIVALKKMRVAHILGQVIDLADLVFPRALRVNYPLAELTAEGPLIEKNEALQRWLQERFLSCGIRYYEETTIFFDE